MRIRVAIYFNYEINDPEGGIGTHIARFRGEVPHSQTFITYTSDCAWLVVIKYNEPSFIKKSIKTKELKTETRDNPPTTHTRT